ncbi:MAG: methyl-accepting chemotaxis protein [Magnetococcus sp. MYC-9]
MFKKLQLTFHLLTLYGLLGGGLLVLIGYCLFVIHRYDETIHAVDREQFPLSHAVTEIARHQLDQAMRFNEVLFFARIGEREKFEVSNEKFVQAGKRLADEILEGRNVAQKGMEMAESEARLKEIDAIKTLLKGIEKSHGDYEHLGALLIRAIYQYDFLSKSGSLAVGDHASAEEEANKHMAFLKSNLSALEDEGRRLEGGIKDVMERVKQLPQSLAIDSARQREQAFQRVLPLMVFALAGGLLLVFVIAGIQKEREQNRNAMTGRSLQLLTEAFGQLQHHVHRWEPVSQQLEQLLTLQQESLAPVVGEMQRGQRLAGGLLPLAEQMEQLIAAEQQALEQAGELIQQLNREAERLLESATESGRTIRHLKDVTMQINLLATNASAEAFRSEATRSFAVFSEEIKELARANLLLAEEITSRTEDAIKYIRADQLHAGQTRHRYVAVTELSAKEVALFAKMVDLIRQQPGIWDGVQEVVTGTHAALSGSAPLLEQAKQSRQGAQTQLQGLQDAVGSWPGGA